MTRRRIPPIKSLTALESVVRTGSVSAAAKDLSVTHGAVSKQLAHLEEWLGQPVFRERRRGMIANASGERLAAAVGAALDQIAAALDEVMTGEAEEDVLTVAAPASFAMRWLIPRLPALAPCDGGAGVRVRPTHTTEDCGSLECDLVIRRGEPLHASLAPRHLFVEQLGLLVAPALMPAADPAHLPYVDAATRTGELARWCTAAFGGVPARPPRVYPHFYVAMEAALSGLGAIVAPVELLRPQLDAGLLVEPFAQVRIPGARYCVGVSAGGRRHRRALGLANAIVEHWQPHCEPRVSSPATG